MVLDDGGDATKILHDRHPDLLKGIRGISEETTTGVNRLYAMMGDGSLKAPAINVTTASPSRNSTTSTAAARASSTASSSPRRDAGGQARGGLRLWQCRQGLGFEPAQPGCRVMVTEIDPICALQAAMEGYQVTTMDEAAPRRATSLSPRPATLT
jgi:adenosylhomocysteinase